MNEFLTDDPRLLEGFRAWRAHEYTRAIELFRRAVVRDPRNPEAWRGLGSVYWSMKQFEKALEAFQRGLCLEPASPVHWSTVGLALRDLKRSTQALNVFAVALAIDDRYHPAWNEFANVHYDLGRYAEALPLYDRAIELYPTRGVYYHNRGECRIQLGERQRAVADFQAALAVEPGYPFSAARLDGIKKGVSS